MDHKTKVPIKKNARTVIILISLILRWIFPFVCSTDLQEYIDCVKEMKGQ